MFDWLFKNREVEKLKKQIHPLSAREEETRISSQKEIAELKKQTRLLELQEEGA